MGQWPSRLRAPRQTVDAAAAASVDACTGEKKKASAKGIVPVGRDVDGKLIYHPDDQDLLDRLSVSLDISSERSIAEWQVRQAEVQPRGIFSIPEGSADGDGDSEAPSSTLPVSHAGGEEEAAEKPVVSTRKSRLRDCFLSLVSLLLGVVVLALIAAIVRAVFFLPSDNAGESRSAPSSDRVKDAQDPTVSGAPSMAPTAPAASTLDLTSNMQQSGPTPPLLIDFTLPPRLAPVHNSCPVCFGGGALQHADAPLLPLGENNITCGELEEAIDLIVAQSPTPAETCLEWQVRASMRCGCGFPHPESYCELCPTLPPPDVLDTVTPIWLQDTKEFATCADLIFSAAAVRQNHGLVCQDVVLPDWAPLCSCAPNVHVTEIALASRPPSLRPTISAPTISPTVPRTPPPTGLLSCPICFDGQPLPNPDALLFASNDKRTCGDLELALDLLVAESEDPSATCLEWQVRASTTCGCTFPHARAHCTLCPDGTLPPVHVLDSPTPLLHNGVALTCRDLILRAATIPNQCHNLEQWASYCACPGYESAVLTPPTVTPTRRPPPPPSLSPTALPSARPSPPSAAMTCPVCHDGGEIAYPHARVLPTLESSNTTCRDLARGLSRVVADSDDPEATCLEWQVRATYRCGCAFPHPRAHCVLCPDGSLPQRKVLNAKTSIAAGNGEVATCSDLIFTAAVSPTPPEVCRVLTRDWAPHCQCPGFEADAQPTPSPTRVTVEPTRPFLSSYSASPTWGTLRPTSFELL